MEQSFIRYLEDVLTRHCGEPVKIKSAEAIGGGCIHYTFRLQSNASDFFIKYNRAALYPQMFEAEAKGLAMLAASRTIRVPSVITSGYWNEKAFLLLEYIRPQQRRKNFWENFGQSLALLHRHTAPYFGLDSDNYIGSLPQYNCRHQQWSSFFVEERLRRQASLAYAAGLIAAAHQRSLEQLYKKIPDLFPDEPPALLHGDLWSGNFIVADDGYACLVDPAVYFGHREMEIAFTMLFGGFDQRFYDAYQDAFPLANGFDARKDICNLYPLLVHLNLFGSSYLPAIERILRCYA
ncbi:MAG: fructosamine kinase [Chitinophagales bacterium]|nr:MAG: fructosamine kinase [Chitinophagales bacterium]